MAGYIGSSAPVNLSTTSADIDGTVTADGLTVDGAVQVNATVPSIVLEETDTTDINGQVAVVSGNTHIRTINDAGNSVTNRVTVSNSTGDISFYEDTGTTAKFFWDASAESLGIGTSSPASNLHVESTGSTGFRLIGGTTGANTIYMGDTASNSAGYIQYSNNADYMRIATSGSERMRIDSSGNVGIGTTSPARPFSVTDQTGDGTGGMILASYLPTLEMDDISGGGTSFILQHDTTNTIFKHDTTERMRIDSSGNLLVGTTSTDLVNNNGIVAAAAGFLDVGRNSLVARFTRRSTDGSIVEFRKDGTTVGSISSTSGLYMSLDSPQGTGFLSVNAALRYGWNNSTFYPHNDNARDLGLLTKRWDDVYATNGTIQTSDQNEKQQIASLTDAEMTAAKAISKLFKTFKWNDSVAEKGDAARTHTGVIAQEVEQAMTDAGLNAGDYAFFISTTWWETQTEVPAVEAVEAQDAVYEDVIIPAVEEVLDEEGNVVTEAQPERTEQRLVSEAVEAVEGKEAYTRTDTYDTAEEAPEGATERNRKGIRYPQLLSFIGAATEQRLASIESRLDALESA